MRIKKNELRETSIGKNLSVAFIANAITLVSNALLTLVLPRFVGVSEYGYYQLYIFYAGYVGFFALGWTDGLYLRHGGEYYRNIDRASMHGQLRVFSGMEMAISMLICVFALLFSESDKATVYIMFALCVLLYLPRAFLHNLLQATNRINEHATGLIIDKVVHIAITALGIAFGRTDSAWFIVSELFGRLCGGCYIFWTCRDVLKARPCKRSKVLFEAKQSISCGFVLMISNVASLLIVGIVRQGIEIFWNVETFGRLSLTLSISNMLMKFINSVAMVVFPLLRRSDEHALSNVYEKMRAMLMVPILGIMVFYYPGRLLLSMWLPQYAESLQYMAVLFVMCVYESKMSMLINTYMKTLRKEKQLLIFNGVSVGLSLIATILTCGVAHNLDMAVFSIIILLAIRSTIAEMSLSKLIDIDVKMDMLSEHAMSVVFILANWFVGGFWGMAIYAVAYGIFILINRDSVRTIIDIVKKRKNLAN